MKKQMKRFFSILMVSAMTLAGFGMAAFATGGTGDATLSNLEVSPGTLSPEFSSDQYEYHVEVGEDCDKILVNTQAADSGAKVVIAGNSGLKAGVNSVVIKVTAADGTTTAKYTIQVTRGTAQVGDGSAAQGGQMVTPGNGIASSPLIMGNKPVSGSSETEGMDSGGESAETEAVTTDEENLEDGQVPGSGEIPEGEGTPAAGENSGTAGQEAGTLVTGGKTYILAEPDEAVVPSGFEATMISVGGQNISAWQFPSNYEVTGLYLIYGTSPEGKTTFYIYDESEGTVITAAEGILSIGQEGEISQNQLRSVQETYQKSLKSRLMIIICLSVVCFILLIALTASLTRRKHQADEPNQMAYRRVPYEKGSELEDDEDDFYEDDDDLDEPEDDFYDEEDGDLYEADDEEDGGPYEAVEDFYDDGDHGSGGEEDYRESNAAVEKEVLYAKKQSGEEAGVPGQEVKRVRQEALEKGQKKEQLTEVKVDEKEPEWDTAPLPSLEDTGKLESIKEAVAAVEKSVMAEEAAAAEVEDFDLEDIDLELFDLEEEKTAALEVKEQEDTDDVSAEESETDGFEEPKPEAVDFVESEKPEPEAFNLEKTKESGPEENVAVKPEGPETEEAGFEEVTLEDVGFGEIQPAEEGEEEEYSDEEEWFPLPEEEEEEDVDAEFDLLDALLSDSLRGGRPDGRK